MDAAQVRVLASELETTLKLLAQLITELESRREEWKGSGVVRQLVSTLAARPNLAELPAVLLRAHAEISEVLGGIRLTREAIEAHAVDRIRDTHTRLSNVTSTTESATLELMNGLDRSIELVNSLEQQSNGSASPEGYQLLRDQVSALYNHLQFQDITAQQLQGVSQSLLDLEVRVAAIAALFDPTTGAVARDQLGREPWSSSSAHLAYNPDATMQRTVADQHMIDETFKGAQDGSPNSTGPASGR
jgi:hypothetical protein